MPRKRGLKSGSQRRGGRAQSFRTERELHSMLDSTAQRKTTKRWLCSRTAASTLSILLLASWRDVGPKAVLSVAERERELHSVRRLLRSSSCS